VNLHPDFKELLSLFLANDVEFLLVGGYAVSVHGYSRYTEDIDLWVRKTPENAKRILHALDEFGFGGLGLTQATLLQEQGLIRLGHPPAKVKILNWVSGLEFEEASPNAIQVEFDELEIPVISLPDLIRNKSASGRLKDLGDLENLPES